MTIFEGTYYFGDQIRWNLGWATPNFAGAFLAMSVPFIWTAFSKCIDLFPSRKPACYVITALVLLLECVLVFLLCKTYSRGALIAMLAGGAIHQALSALRRHASTQNAPPIKYSTWRSAVDLTTWLVILFIFISATNFHSRVSVDHVASDKSVTNRLAFWQATTEMIYVAPLNGWGGGESGRVYNNWFQDIGRNEVFATPVNSYLHVGVEFGLPILCIALAVVIFCIAGGLGAVLKPNGRNTTRIAIVQLSLVVVVIWAVVNLFSTLWTQPRLWIAPSICIIYLLFEILVCSSRKLTLRLTGLGMGLALSTALPILLIGWHQSNARQIHVRPSPVDEGSFSLNGTKAAKSVACLDSSVLGPVPGRELRRLVSQNPNLQNMTVLGDLAVHTGSLSDVEQVLLFGRHASRVAQYSNTKCRIWIIHPLGAPPTTPLPDGSSIHVVLPGVDETGDATRWQLWAKNAVITHSGPSGQDIRILWPDCLAGQFDSLLKKQL